MTSGRTVLIYLKQNNNMGQMSAEENNMGQMTAVELYYPNV